MTWARPCLASAEQRCAPPTPGKTRSVSTRAISSPWRTDSFHACSAHSAALTRHVDVAPVLLHDAVDLRQPEPRSPPVFGGEEGLEEAPLDGRGHAGAGVRHRECGPFARRQTRNRWGFAAVQRAAGELDPEPSPARHRVARVESE